MRKDEIMSFNLWQLVPDFAKRAIEGVAPLSTPEACALADDQIAAIGSNFAIDDEPPKNADHLSHIVRAARWRYQGDGGHLSRPLMRTYLLEDLSTREGIERLAQFFNGQHDYTDFTALVDFIEGLDPHVVLRAFELPDFQLNQLMRRDVMKGKLLRGLWNNSLRLRANPPGEISSTPKLHPGREHFPQ